MFESISDGYCAFDRRWRCQYANGAAARMLATNPEELLGKTLWELWPLAAGSPFGETCRRAVADSSPVHVETFYGEPLNIWFEVRCYPSPEGLSLCLTDTTARRLAAAQSRLLSSIVECSDDAIVSETLDGFVLTWNPAAERVYGYSAEEIVGQPLARLLRPDRQDEIDEILEHIRLGQRIEHMETERIRKDGQPIFVSV